MVVPYKIVKELKLLDLNKICLFEFATTLYSYGQSIFEPIRKEIPKKDYILFFEPHFDNCEFVKLVDFEFLEHVRVELLRLNGFKTASGYVHSKKEVLFVDDWIL